MRGFSFEMPTKAMDIPGINISSSRNSRLCIHFRQDINNGITIGYFSTSFRPFKIFCCHLSKRALTSDRTKGILE